MPSLRRITILVLLLAATPCSAQRSIEVTGGAGYTAMDVEAWHEGPVNDWNQFMSGFSVRVLPLEVAGLTLGLEGGYRYLTWYSYRFLSNTLEVDVAAYPVMGLVRVPLSDFFASEFSGGVFIFDGGSDPALGAALIGRIPVAASWHVPVRLHTEVVFDAETNLVPLGVQLGIAYDFD